MTTDDIARFIADLKTDAGLQAEVKAQGGGIAALVVLAVGRGYRMTVEAVETYLRTHAAVIGDEQLDAIAGGILDKSKPVAGMIGQLGTGNT